jgi:hypothetical protein
VAAPKHNQNARKGKHPSQVLRLSVELVDALYECLALDGEPLTEDNPERINDYALGILSGYVRRRIEDNEAIIL